MIKTIGVHIKVADFEESKKFYEALGFTKVFAYGPKEAVKEAYNGVTFQQGECKLEIADGHRAVKPEVFKSRMVSSKVSLIIPVDNLQDILNRCRKHKIKIAVPIRHYYWGTLELVVKDQDGVVLVFIQPFDEKTATSLKADETFGRPPVN